MKNLKYFIPSLIIMIIIFSFSVQNGEESSGLSSSIVAWIYTHLHISISEFLIRKAAHMSEYGILSLSLIYGFYQSGFSLKYIILYTLIITFLYACTDEFHQLFVNDRSGQLSDVFIDTCGGAIATFLYFMDTKRRN
ncbi:MAG: VanZ family protein [Erysipelotrichaceae bacterium]|nr:VanZ family protein [Erysipelotrichaceae bacterium]